METAAQTTIPPSTTRTWPVTYAARSEASHSTAPATSSGRPSRPRAICSNKAARAASGKASVMSVAMNPGATALASTWRLAVLTGLLKKIVPEAQGLTLGTADEVERFLQS